MRRAASFSGAPRRASCSAQHSSAVVDLPSISVSPSHVYGTVDSIAADRALDELIVQLFDVYDFRGQKHLTPVDFRCVQRLVSRVTHGSHGPILRAGRSRPSSGVAPHKRVSIRSSSLPPGADSAVGLEVATDRSSVMWSPPGPGSIPQRRTRSPIASRRAPHTPTASSTHASRTMDMDAKPFTPTRSSSLQRYSTAEFKDVDRNAVGQIDFVDFRHWQLELLRATKKNRPAKQQRLAWLVRELGLLIKEDEQILALKCLATSARCASNLKTCGDMHGAIVALKDAIMTAGRTFVHERDTTLAEFDEQLLCMVREHREDLLRGLEAANDVSVLEACISAAEEATSYCPAISAEALQPYFEKLRVLRAPFPVRVGTLAGAEARLEATRGELVGNFKSRVADQLGVKAYRLSLNSTTRRLGPNTASLEECGVCQSEELVATFEERDRFMELSIPELLELGVRHGALTRSQAESLQESVAGGKITSADILAKHSLKHRIEHNEARIAQRERKEAEAQKRKAAVERERKELEQFADKVAEEANAEMMKKLAASTTEEVVDQIVMTQGIPLTRDDLCTDRTAETKPLLFDCLCQHAAEMRLRQEAESIMQKMDVQKVECIRVKEDVEADLGMALPVLHDAFGHLKNLKLADMQEIRALACPPRSVKLALEALCVMLQIRPVMKPDPNYPGRKIKDYWEPSKLELLCNPKHLLDMLFDYDKDDICPKVLLQIEPYILHEDFSPDIMRRASVACAAFCAWVRGMHSYARVAKVVEPKRMMLLSLENQLQDVCRRHKLFLDHAEAERQRVSVSCNKVLEWSKSGSLD